VKSRSGSGRAAKNLQVSKLNRKSRRKRMRPKSPSTGSRQEEWSHRICGNMALPYRWLLTRFLIAVSPLSLVEGFQLVRVDSGNERLVCDRLGEALRLVRNIDPPRFQRIRRDIRRILVVKAGGPEYWPLAGGFILNRDYVTEAPVELVALTIVHEATHARLWKLGFRYRQSLRARIEAVCVRSEIRFAGGLPAGVTWIRHAEEKLEHPWWTDDKVSERRLSAMRLQGWPGWLLRVLNAVSKSERHNSRTRK
jgi:hypothetical protein